MMAEAQTVRGSLTQASLRLMQELMDTWSKHPFFVQLARKIVSLAGAQDFASETRAVWRWIRDHVEYRADPVGTQWIQDPFETAVTSKAGNCANMTILSGTLLQALGHPARALAVRWEGRDTFSHAVAADDRVGVVCDPVNPAFEWPPRPVADLMEAY